MNELVEALRESFADEEYRNAYAESFMNSYVAAQIRTLREEFPLTQEQLAEKTGTKQPGIARLENVNYASWKVESLRKLARAFGVRLKITFEEFGTLPRDIEHFRRETLRRLPFTKDPVYFPPSGPVAQYVQGPPKFPPVGIKLMTLQVNSAQTTNVAAAASIIDQPKLEVGQTQRAAAGGKL